MSVLDHRKKDLLEDLNALEEREIPLEAHSVIEEAVKEKRIGVLE